MGDRDKTNQCAEPLDDPLEARNANWYDSDTIDVDAVQEPVSNAVGDFLPDIFVRGAIEMDAVGAETHHVTRTEDSLIGGGLNAPVVESSMMVSSEDELLIPKISIFRKILYQVSRERDRLGLPTTNRGYVRHNSD